MDNKFFTLVNSILVYVLVKYQGFIFFPKEIIANVSVISEQPSYMYKNKSNVRFCIEVIIIYSLPTQAALTSLTLSYNDVSITS